MIFQFILFNIFGYLGNISRISIATETFILTSFFFSSSITLDYIIPVYYKKHINWYTEDDSKCQNTNYKIITRNLFTFLLFNIGIDKLLIAEPEQFTTWLYFYNIFLLLPLSFFTHVLFFYTHTHLHSPSLKHFHKIHHDYKEPTALSGFHSHIFEFVYSNIISIFLPIYIFNINKYYKIGYLITALFNIFISHLSYYPKNKKLQFLFSFSKYHFIHHQEPRFNRGLKSGYMDKLHNTYKNSYKKSYKKFI